MVEDLHGFGKAGSVREGGDGAEEEEGGSSLVVGQRGQLESDPRGRDHFQTPPHIQARDIFLVSLEG